MKRLTIDVPLALPQAIKSQCAVQGENMADVIRSMLEQRFIRETKLKSESTSDDAAT